MHGAPPAWQGPGFPGIGAAGLADPAAWSQVFSALPALTGAASPTAVPRGGIPQVSLDPAKGVSLQDDYGRGWSALWSS